MLFLSIMSFLVFLGLFYCSYLCTSFLLVCAVPFFPFMSRLSFLFPSTAFSPISVLCCL
ncbi:hypothetical protein BC829DRAFT_393214, partial [Chytridium lagenaria]